MTKDEMVLADFLVSHSGVNDMMTLGLLTYLFLRFILSYLPPSGHRRSLHSFAFHLLSVMHRESPTEHVLEALALGIGSTRVADLVISREYARSTRPDMRMEREEIAKGNGDCG